MVVSSLLFLSTGGIELAILADVFKTEIRAVNIQTRAVLNFGEGKGYTRAVFLMYDGIHYDPLVASPKTVKIFSTLSEAQEAEKSAIALANSLHQQRAFTDLEGFSLRCMVCQEALKGEREAQAHAKKTGHTNFGEV